MAQMLADGEIDALHTARKPSTMDSRPDTIRRLFENYEQVGRDYFAETSIFPIMHTMAVRSDVADAHPWVLTNLSKAFNEAKRLATDMKIGYSWKPIDDVFGLTSVGESGGPEL